MRLKRILRDFSRHDLRACAGKLRTSSEPVVGTLATSHLPHSGHLWHFHACKDLRDMQFLFLFPSFRRNKICRFAILIYPLKLKKVQQNHAVIMRELEKMPVKLCIITKQFPHALRVRYPPTQASP